MIRQGWDGHVPTGHDYICWAQGMDMPMLWIVLHKAWIHTLCGVQATCEWSFYIMWILPCCKCCLTMKNWSVIVNQAAFNYFIQLNCVETGRIGEVWCYHNHTLVRPILFLHKSKLCTFCTEKSRNWANPCFVANIYVPWTNMEIFEPTRLTPSKLRKKMAFASPVLS